jgi:prenyl protein peptidase
VVYNPQTKNFSLDFQRNPLFPSLYKYYLIPIIDEFQVEKIHFIRNIIFAPISEEIVFRGILVPTLFLSFLSNNQSPFSLVYLSSVATLWFGVAHMHHLIEKLRMGEQPMNAILITSFQFIYTSIFGCLAGMLLLCTGNIYAPIVSHMICNYVALPNLYFLREQSIYYSWRYVLLLIHGLGLILFVIMFEYITSSLRTESVYYRLQTSGH